MGPMQVLLAALQLTNAAVAGDITALEAAYLLGLVPPVLRYCRATWPRPLRVEAAAFVDALCCGSPASARMLVACQACILTWCCWSW